MLNKFYNFAGIFERFRGILHEGEIDKRVQFLIEGEEEDDGPEGEKEDEENVACSGTAAGAQRGQQGVVVLGENFFEVEAIRRKRVRKVKSSLFFSSLVILGLLLFLLIMSFFF